MYRVVSLDLSVGLSGDFLREFLDLELPTLFGESGVGLLSVILENSRPYC